MPAPSRSMMRRSTLPARWLVSTWLPALLGMLVIACESTIYMGAAQTSQILRPLVQSIFGMMSDTRWQALHHYIRKSGHFCGYGTLTLLFLRAWHRTFWLKMQPAYAATRHAGGMFSRLQIDAATAALISTILVASSDEIHQTFLPGRTGLFSDVLIDSSGALIFLLLYCAAHSLRRRSLQSH
jgi:VanZ family protein